MSSAPRLARFPSPSVQPTTTRSASSSHFTFTHSAERSSARYVDPARFATTPSRPRSRHCWKSAFPSSNVGWRRRSPAPGAPSRILDRQPGDVATADDQHVEHDEHDRNAPRDAACASAAHVDARSEALEIRLPLLVEGDHLSVEDDALLGEQRERLGDLGVALGRVAEAAIPERHARTALVGHDADAVELQLEEPALVTEQALARLVATAEHRHEPRAVAIAQRSAELDRQLLRRSHKPKCRPRRRAAPSWRPALVPDFW
jgi:hypothetical protein